jgi:hypothetical protein
MLVLHCHLNDPANISPGEVNDFSWLDATHSGD